MREETTKRRANELYKSDNDVVFVDTHFMYYMHISFDWKSYNIINK